MKCRSIALLSLAVASLVLGSSAAAGGGCEPRDSAHTQSSGTSVEIVGCKFAPVVLFAPVGATVNWKVAESGPPHNIHGLGWGMRSGELLGQGLETKQMFERPGIYPYQCSLHPGMSGVVIVGDGQLAEAAPPQSARVAGGATQPGTADGLTAAGAAAALVLTALGAYRIGRRRTHGV